VLMSTHYIEEAERLADTVAVMARGRIVAQGPPQQLVREHAGREAHEVYGPPARLEQLRAQADAAGWVTRRAGTALAILHAERHDANGGLPDGERRAASLEDAFVVLTGEEVE
jgi:lipooligosaccharide transport system ATP-binding protein